MQSTPSYLLAIQCGPSLFGIKQGVLKMSRAQAGFSVADLERIMEERKSQLQELVKKRDAAQKELDKLDAEIQDLVGAGGTVGRYRRRRRRVKNEMSLRAVVLEILGKNKKG